MRETFLLYTDIGEVLEEMDDKSAAALFRAIVEYEKTDIVPVIDDPMAKIAFIPVRQKLDINNQKWEEEKKKRKKAAEIANEAKRKKIAEAERNQNVSELNGMQSEPIGTDTEPNGTDRNAVHADNVLVLDNVSVLDNVPVLDNVSPSETKKNIVGQQSQDIADIVTYLNAICKTHYKPSTESTKKKITSLLRQGFTVDDFKQVIDKKSKEWMGTEFEQYLRPETLFSTKFEGYLNQQIRPTARNGTINNNESWAAAYEEVMNDRERDNTGFNGD